MPTQDHPISAFAPLFKKVSYPKTEKNNLSPFFTNLNKNTYVPLIFSPEVIGALCSRTSRASEDLRPIFLKEYINPFLNPGKAKNPKEAKEIKKYGEELSSFIEFLKKHPIEKIFSNPKARSFYAKWLAQYGDDSIAQMAGAHLVYTGLSQLAIKHLEDQRIGLAPIEKSTRYVDYSQKINGQFQYYIDPTLKDHGLEEEYKEAMDALFTTYVDLLPKVKEFLTQKFPKESAGVIEKKAFDTLRGLLPVATLSQVAFFGNGQAFEYMITRCAKHQLGEVRWAGETAYEELYKVVPSFLRRVKDTANKANIESYQGYIAGRADRVQSFVKSHVKGKLPKKGANSVELIEYDANGENNILAGMLYNAPNNELSWKQAVSAIKRMSKAHKEKLIAKYFSGRSQRWQKVGRALENSYVRFEIMMNIGAWRDLHRHRMLTQQRQLFTTKHGYDLPPELTEAGLDKDFKEAVTKAEAVFTKIAKINPYLAQYAVTMAHRVRFMQWQNIREAFWEVELRTIPEGHPDYRIVEQQKFTLLEKVYPLLAKHMRVNMGQYDFARRGQEELKRLKLA